MIKFIRSGFDWNCGYTVHTRNYDYFGLPQIGYVLVKNYICFWIPGYDKVEVFVAAGVILGISLALYMTFKQLSIK